MVRVAPQFQSNLPWQASIGLGMSCQLPTTLSFWLCGCNEISLIVRDCVCPTKSELSHTDELTSFDVLVIPGTATLHVWDIFLLDLSALELVLGIEHGHKVASLKSEVKSENEIGSK